MAKIEQVFYPWIERFRKNCSGFTNSLKLFPIHGVCMPYSNISATLSNTDRDAIIARLNEIKALLPFVVSLTPDERSTMLKMGDRSIPFVEKSLVYAQANPNLVPPYLDVAELKKDFELVKTLTSVLTPVLQLSQSLDDTYMALGSEAFNAALTFYNTTRDASKRNVPGAKAIYDDLSQRFPRKGSRVADVAEAPKTT